MGQRADCRLTYRGKTVAGTALLEAAKLIFRGPERLVVPLTEIKAAAARGNELHVSFGDRSARFDIGPAAAAWADRIRNPRSRADKLGIKDGMAVLFIRCRDRALSDEVRSRGARIVGRPPAGGADVIFFGAERRDDLEGLPNAAGKLKQDGALWVIRPKGTKTITEAQTMAAGRSAGLVDVKVVSFSQTHTAEKFVIPRASRRP